MRIGIDFDSLEEALPFLQAGLNMVHAPTPTAPTAPVAAFTVETVSVPGPEKPKRTRRTKAEIAAAVVTPVPEVAAQESEFEDTPTAPSDFLDDDVPAVALTKDDVRAALVTYQERLVAAGKDVDGARVVVLALLKKVSGADTLGACPEDKFAAVIEAAKTAK